MRIPARLLGLVCPIALLALTGCVSVSPDKRFPDVHSDVLARANARAVWRQGGPEDRAVDDAIAALLARPLLPEDAVQIALFGNSGLQATFEDLGIAQAEVVTAGQLRNPDIVARIQDFIRAQGEYERRSLPPTLQEVGNVPLVHEPGS